MCTNQCAVEISRCLSRLTRLRTHTAIEDIDGRNAPEVTETLEYEIGDVRSLSRGGSLVSSERNDSSSLL